MHRPSLLRAARPLALLLPLAASCSDGTDVDSTSVAATRMVVDPAAFRGSLNCGTAPGSFQTYQATIIDMTDGVEAGFSLPTSPVTPCHAATTFELVEPGHRYAAFVSGYDRSDIEQQLPGVPVVVDESGATVVPRWAAICWGHDNEDYSDIYVGGMGGSLINDGRGGFGGSSSFELGATASEFTAVTIRGCDGLGILNDPTLTGLSVDIVPALVGRSCGTEPGQVESFSLRRRDDGAADSSPPDSSSALGGMGGLPGMGGSGGQPEPTEKTACGDTAVATGLPPGAQIVFQADAYEAGQDEPRWTTECRGYPLDGVIVPANCDPLLPVLP